LNKNNLQNEQNSLEHKIVSGLERISLVYRTLLWEEAKKYGLSPIQVQILIFVQSHDAQLATVSRLSLEFNLTKPTISDAIKSLVEKKLVTRVSDKSDSRSFRIALTSSGRKLATNTENYTAPLVDMISQVDAENKLNLWQNITSLIRELNRAGLLTAQRACFSCAHFNNNNGRQFCNLINSPLADAELRIDCPDFSERLH
jgi:DNA-binding MarR family transcriptional regulator